MILHCLSRSYMSEVCRVCHAGLHFRREGQQLQLLCEGQRECFLLFLHQVLHNGAGNKRQTQKSVSADRWLSVMIFIQRMFLSGLQWGCVPSVLQLLSQLLVLLPETLQQRKVIKQQLITGRLYSNMWEHVPLWCWSTLLSVPLSTLTASFSITNTNEKSFDFNQITKQEKQFMISLMSPKKIEKDKYVWESLHSLLCLVLMPRLLP